MSARHPSRRGYTRHPRCAVDQDSATAALTLGTAPVFDRLDTELLAEDVEEGRRFVSYRDFLAVYEETDR